VVGRSGLISHGCIRIQSKPRGYMLMSVVISFPKWLNLHKNELQSFTHNINVLKEVKMGGR
jgi:hypothetical protein